MCSLVLAVPRRHVVLCSETDLSRSPFAVFLLTMAPISICLNGNLQTLKQPCVQSYAIVSVLCTNYEATRLFQVMTGDAGQISQHIPLWEALSSQPDIIDYTVYAVTITSIDIDIIIIMTILPVFV